MVLKNSNLISSVDEVICAMYIKNSCPSHALKNKNHYEIRYGHIPSMRSLRVFGSPYYALILRNEETNLVQ